MSYLRPSLKWQEITKLLVILEALCEFLYLQKCVFDLHTFIFSWLCQSDHTPSLRSYATNPCQNQQVLNKELNYNIVGNHVYFLKHLTKSMEANNNQKVGEYEKLPFIQSLWSYITHACALFIVCKFLK